MGTGTPFEQFRPGIKSRLADSVRASAAFSTACHPPKVLTKGSVAIEGSLPGTNFTSPGLSICAEKTTLDAGYRTPRISWFRSDWTCIAGVGGLGGAAAFEGVCADRHRPKA